MIGCPRLSVSWLGHLPCGLGVLTRRQCVNCGPSSSHVQGDISNPKPFPPLPLSGAQPELEAITRLGEQTECLMGPCLILELRWRARWCLSGPRALSASVSSVLRNEFFPSTSALIFTPAASDGENGANCYLAAVWGIGLLFSSCGFGLK